MQALKRRKETSRVFLRGDSKLWETECGRVRLRYITGCGGVRVKPHWHVMRWEFIAGRGLWNLVGRHRKRSAAMRTLDVTLRRITSE